MNKGLKKGQRLLKIDLAGTVFDVKPKPASATPRKNGGRYTLAKPAPPPSLTNKSPRYV